MQRLLPSTALIVLLGIISPASASSITEQRKPGVGTAQHEVGFTTTWSRSGDLQGFREPDRTARPGGRWGESAQFLKAVKATIIVPKPYLRSNLGKLFGTGPGTISFDVKALGDGSICPAWPSSCPRAPRLSDSRSRQQAPRTRSDRGRRWIHYSIPWKADWTEEQAIRSGWQPYSGKTDRWANVIDNPIWSQLEISSVADKGAGAQSIGIDNFRVEAGQVLDAKRRKLVIPDPPQQKPVVHYAFDEGTGNLLHDRRRQRPGKIHGATWVRNGRRSASSSTAGQLRRLRRRAALGAQTLAAWIYAEPIYSVFLGVPIAGDGNCQFFQHVHEIRGSGTSDVLPFRKWIHVAQSWDGQSTRLYVDGTLVTVGVPWNLPAATSCWHLCRAISMSLPTTSAASGKIASIMLYNRANRG